MVKEENIEIVIDQLYKDSRLDGLKMLKVAPKFIFSPMLPEDFKDVYLSISRKQGEDLRKLILKKNIKDVVEFGTSFGISTLFLAQGVIETKGHIITTELIETKAIKALQNFEKAGVSHIIDLRIGDALETLKNHQSSIDLLLLDGWKDLYLPLFKMLEPNFHKDTVIYVDNANMSDAQEFLKVLKNDTNYILQPMYDRKVVLVTLSQDKV
ncbi:O-methyltransferase [Seonamhaeicola marinus]|uniref:Methyltransferase n=1 Tax=Seonamhaeicola marinus TaxID=1912246 RepID=A0A5D0J7M1_9FLAO|nr:class I SAM-dependent methyltransferase [Seonamhaeicola marinus]TYA92193.1 hypothetical protein FUA24_01825 [Seonamhaeicola marinus]